SENDFGVMGSTPSHPEFLDWLANELRAPSFGVEGQVSRDASGGEQSADLAIKSEFRIPKSEISAAGSPHPQAWRLKRLHRLIVLSNTYAQSSDYREEAAKIDVDNIRLWRFPYRRLDAEAVRDSVLSVNGRLNPKMGGPGVYPKIARAV